MNRPRIEDGKIHTYRGWEISQCRCINSDTEWKKEWYWEASRFSWSLAAITWTELKEGIDRIENDE